EWRLGPALRRIRDDRARCLFCLSRGAQDGRPRAGVPRFSGIEGPALAFLMPHGRHAHSRVVRLKRAGLDCVHWRRTVASFHATYELSAVPLWKVIVGPRADKLEPDPQGSGFFVADALTGLPEVRPAMGLEISRSHR